jgi:hypothetical protein
VKHRRWRALTGTGARAKSGGSIGLIGYPEMFEYQYDIFMTSAIGSIF